MVTLYWILKYITFPGSLLKGFLEHLFCRIYKIPVEYGEYMQRNELCGHVEHSLAPKKGSFALCFGPHILMLLCGLVTLFPASIGLFYLGVLTPANVILLYIGTCFLFNCFPLYEDALNMWDHLFGEHSTAKGASRVFLSIPAVILRAGAWLEQYGISFLTTLVFAYFLAFIVARFL